MVKVCNILVDEMLGMDTCEVCMTEIYNGMFNIKGNIAGENIDVNLYASNKAAVEGIIDTCMSSGLGFERACSELGVLVEANI